VNKTSNSKFPDIRRNLDLVREQINSNAQAAGRDPESIKLVVVTKNQPIDKILALVELGVRKVGENYAEEALPKIDNPELQKISNLEWHMIGHIQSRKARTVIENFDCIHSLDSIKLAKRLDRFAGDFGKKMPVYLECNVSGEESKYGFNVWKRVMLEPFLDDIRKIMECQNLKILGLMTMPPYTTNAEDSRKHFIALRRLSKYLMDNIPDGDWRGLSMGMSQDYQIAIHEGATVLRIGQAILGPRP